MRIAILGASSQIARDLILSCAAHETQTLVLYARRPQAVDDWLAQVNLSERYPIHGFDAFNTDEHFDAIINFVGVGDPAQAAAMGASIFDVTLQYDNMALDYLRLHPTCRYIFLSSGIAYGASFNSPVDANSCAIVPINNLQPQDWYGSAKLHAECRHRSRPDLSIIDIRVFNYFSSTQNLDARFLITDIARAIRDKTLLITSGEEITRDFVHPSDFFQLIFKLLVSKPENAVVDCYSKAPVLKSTLLKELSSVFGLQYQIKNSATMIHSTGNKANYYSLNRRAESFGYAPIFTSLDGIGRELRTLFQSLPRH